MDHKKSLLQFICDNFMVEEDEINLNESLIDQGIIDSFGLVEIAEFLKKEFQVETQQSEMNRSNFGSVHKLVAYVERKSTLISQ